MNETRERAPTQATVPGFTQAESSLARYGESPPALLPRDLAIVRDRLEQLGFVAAALAAVNYPLWLVTHEHGPRPTMFVASVVALGLASVICGLAIAFAARSKRLSDTALFRAGQAWILVLCILLSIDAVLLNGLLGLQPARMAFTCVAIVVFPLFVPTPPKRMAVIAILATATQPLALLLPVGQVITRDTLTSSIANAALSAVLAIACARILWGLRVTASAVRQIGSYQLEELIGRGGMGEVWRAKHSLLARPAAVKLIAVSQDKDTNAHMAMLRRFEREAQVTAALTSTHTVTLYEFGVSDEGTLYYVMELLRGRDLQAYVEEHGPLPVDQTVRVALAVCDSLGEAHARGLIHRDLKPANVMLCAVGRRTDFVKVLDFGLAELARRLSPQAADSSATEMRTAGTPHYMPPEVYSDKAIDGRSDLYQLGCVMFFLLTGKRPYRAKTRVALAVAQLETAPLVSTKCAHPVPAELDEIVARCLAVAPEDRYESVEAVEAALVELERSLRESA